MKRVRLTRTIGLVFLMSVSALASQRSAFATSDVTSLCTWSQPQSPLGNGAADTLDESRATFSTTALSNGSVRVQVMGSLSWTLAFGPGSGRALAAGAYQGAIDCADCISLDARPRIDLLRNASHCFTTLPGSFQVRRLKRAPDGTIAALWVRFDQSCASPSAVVSGDLRIHADTSIYLDVPARVATETGRQVRVNWTGRAREIAEREIPVREDVRSACELLGLDPLHVANEGRFVAFVTAQEASQALDVLRRFDVAEGATVIGKVAAAPAGRVTCRSAIGGTHVVDRLSGSQLPRIC